MRSTLVLALLVLACGLRAAEPVAPAKPVEKANAACDPNDVDGCAEGCKAGSIESCNRFAALGMSGKAVIAEGRTPSEVLVRGCELGSSSACLIVGTIHAYPPDQKDPNAEEAEKHYLRACELGEPRGCNNLGVACEKGEGRPKDVARAMELYRRACTAKQGLACKNVGRLLRDGVGREPDEKRAREWFERAASFSKAGCESGVAEDCSNLGFMYRSGTEGLPKDEARSAELLAKACSLGYAVVCRR